MAIDLDRLLKYLHLTTSDQHGEAATAMRFANNFLKQSNLTWAELFDLIFKEGVAHQKAQTPHRPARQPRPQRKPRKTRQREPNYREVIAQLLRNPELNDWERGFLRSVYGYVLRDGATPKQLQAVERIARKYDISQPA